MDNWLIEQEVDLALGNPVPQVWPHALMVCGDNRAHTWRVTVRNRGKPANLTGTVTGYFLRGDGVTVPVPGSLTDNVASVVLAQNCYSMDGGLLAVMRLETDDERISLASVILPVRKLLTDRLVAPEYIIPSFDALLERVEHIEAAMGSCLLKSSLRTLALSLAASAWTGSGPYTATISRSDVTAKTWVDIQLTAASLANYSAAINWETSAGKITLTTAVKPVGTLAGTLVLMEVI